MPSITKRSVATAPPTALKCSPGSSGPGGLRGVPVLVWAPLVTTEAAGVAPLPSTIRAKPRSVEGVPHAPAPAHPLVRLARAPATLRAADASTAGGVGEALLLLHAPALVGLFGTSLGFLPENRLWVRTEHALILPRSPQFHLTPWASPDRQSPSVHSTRTRRLPCPPPCTAARTPAESTCPSPAGSHPRP